MPAHITTETVKTWIESKMLGYYDYQPKKETVEVIEDPKVMGTFAATFRDEKLDGEKIGLLFITGTSSKESSDDVLEETLEEVEFNSWPPVSGDLKFFI